jgi:hypothetical protein
MEEGQAVKGGKEGNYSVEVDGREKDLATGSIVDRDLGGEIHRK